MKRYFDHMKTKTPHQRRGHAAQVAGLFTALAFVVWITTLGVRFGGSITQNQNGNPFDGSTPDQTQLAGAAASDNQSGIEVVSTSTNDTQGTSQFSNYGTSGINQ
jgi:hypothetical protein